MNKLMLSPRSRKYKIFIRNLMPKKTMHAPHFVFWERTQGLVVVKATWRCNLIDIKEGDIFWVLLRSNGAGKSNYNIHSCWCFDENQVRAVVKNFSELTMFSTGLQTKQDRCLGVVPHRAWFMIILFSRWQTLRESNPGFFESLNKKLRSAEGLKSCLFK